MTRKEKQRQALLRQRAQRLLLTGFSEQIRCEILIRRRVRGEADFVVVLGTHDVQVSGEGTTPEAASLAALAAMT